MADIAPTGSTVTIPNSNFVVPGLDTFNDFVAKVNASIAGLGTGLNSAAAGSSVADLAKTVNDNNTKVQSDLSTAIKDLTAKFYVAQTSSTPTASPAKSGAANWIVPVVAFLALYLYLEKKKPL